MPTPVHERGVQSGDLKLQRNLDRGGVRVVGALAEVDVLERIQMDIVTTAVADQFERALLATTSLVFMLVDVPAPP